ncbi:MAG: LuxR family transcriptional regulator [Rhodospirillales bacterium]|nr:LuxR family transcriptional regulator [Rhodospirillales bacterium]
MKQFAQDAIARFATANSALEVWAEASRALEYLGFCKFAYAFQHQQILQFTLDQSSGAIVSSQQHRIRESSDSRQSFAFFDNFPGEFNERYWKDGFAENDPGTPYCLNKLAPTSAWINPDLLSSNRAAQKLAEEMRGIGCKSGMVIPLRDNQPWGIGGAGIYHNMNEAEFFRFVAERQNSILLLLICAHTSLQDKFHESARLKCTLTARECEVLLWSAKGLESEEISERICLSLATVNFHVANAMKRLGAATRTQAVARAMLNGAIKP